MTKKLPLIFYLLLLFFIPQLKQSKKISPKRKILSLIQKITYEQKCTSNSDCLALYNCSLKKNTCQHKKLFPMTTREIIGSIIIAIIVGLANAGGMGGGPVMVPLIIGFFNYSLKTGVMISYLLVCGGALGNYCRFGFIRNEKTGGPVINYDIILISIPLLVTGATFGVYANRIFPDLFITIILALVCLQALYRAWNRTKKEYKNENLIKLNKKEETNQTDDVRINKNLILILIFKYNYHLITLNLL